MERTPYVEDEFNVPIALSAFRDMEDPLTNRKAFY